MCNNFNDNMLRDYWALLSPNPVQRECMVLQLCICKKLAFKNAGSINYRTQHNVGKNA